MIQIYSRENNNFSNNGDMTLFPDSCTLTARLNGIWKITMTHSLDVENRWKYIEPEAVLAVPTFMGAKQLFRISDKIEKNDYEINVTAYPIFWDAADEHMLIDVRPTGKTGQQALNIMTNGTKYSGKSNITDVKSAYFIRRNLIDALNGESEPNFIKTWGGEMIFDNYEVIINDRVGGDYGYEVRYGKNMEGVRHTIDLSNVITRIFPVAYNGYTLSSNYVDSPLIENYVKVYAREMVFSDVKMRADANEDDEEKGIIICDTQEELDEALITKCNKQYAAGVDLMKVTISVDMIDLSSTEEYKDFKDLEKVSLGDTVRCYNSRLDIATEQRVVEIGWDCIENKVMSAVLGDYEATFIDKTTSVVNRVESTITEDGQVMAERVQGILDGIKTQLKIQSTAAEKQDVRAILFEDLDTESELYGALALGTQGLQISRERTADGRDWNWTTAFTASGGYADAIITGLFSDKTGRNWWNLDTGEFHLEKYPTDDEVAVLFAISENGIMSSVEKIYETKDSAEDNYTLLRSSITQNAESISMKVEKGEVCSEISQSAEEILLKGNRVLIEADNFHLAKTGDVIANSFESNNAKIKGGSINIEAASGVSIISLKTNDMYLIHVRPSSFRTLGSLNGSVNGIGVDCNMIAGGQWTALSEDASIAETTFAIYSDDGSAFFNGDVGVYGAKNRIVQTENYRERLLYCYEMSSPIFGDMGEGKTDETGKCFIFLDEKFGETIDAQCNYQVFLQPYGDGNCYITERNSCYFIVEGTPDLSFGWELKAVQKDYDTRRLEEYNKPEMEESTISETEAYLSLLINEESTLQENEAYLEKLVYTDEMEDET